jgi:hypothetical protein
MIQKRSLFALVLGAALGAAQPLMAQELGVSLRLQLFAPELISDIRVGGADGIDGSSFSAEDELDAEGELTVPAFELLYDSGAAGRFGFEYFDLRLRGSTDQAPQILFDGRLYPAGARIRSRYEFRSMKLTGAFPFPLADWFDAEARFSLRYLRWFTSLSAPEALAVTDETTRVFVPSLGGGADVFVFDGLFAFGSYELVGFSVDSGLASQLVTFADDDADVFLRDWRVGLRYEITPYLELRGEYRSLKLRIKAKEARYRQTLDGWSGGVAVSF